MIHTDGRPTIANAPRAAAATTPVETPREYPDPDAVLCERHCAGLDVYLVHQPDTGLSGILVREGDDEGFQAALVPSDRLLDAFEHPYLYLA